MGLGFRVLLTGFLLASQFPETKVVRDETTGATYVSDMMNHRVQTSGCIYSPHMTHMYPCKTTIHICVSLALPFARVLAGQGWEVLPSQAGPVPFRTIKEALWGLRRWGPHIRRLP